MPALERIYTQASCKNAQAQRIDYRIFKGLQKFHTLRKDGENHFPHPQFSEERCSVLCFDEKMVFRKSLSVSIAAISNSLRMYSHIVEHHPSYLEYANSTAIQ